MFRIAIIALAAICLSSCDGTGKKRSLILDNDIWVLQDADTDSGNAGEEGFQAIEFLQDGQLQGRGHCNQFSGHYSTDNKKNTDKQVPTEERINYITLTVDGMTMTICPKIEEEQAFVNNLEKTRSYKIIENQLTLMNEKGDIISTFVPASSIQKKRL